MKTETPGAAKNHIDNDHPSRLEQKALDARCAVCYGLKSLRTLFPLFPISSTLNGYFSVCHLALIQTTDVFYKPVTISCGHTFCKGWCCLFLVGSVSFLEALIFQVLFGFCCLVLGCLERIQDHRCPQCRRTFMEFPRTNYFIWSYIQNEVRTHFLIIAFHKLFKGDSSPSLLTIAPSKCSFLTR